MIFLEVLGPPVPSGRPRFKRIGKSVATYPDPRDRAGKARIIDAWRAAGEPCLDDGALWAADLHFTIPRPPTHWLKGGGLSAAGRRVAAPPGDVDNLAKLCCDALVAVGAVPDDRACVRLLTTKEWAPKRKHIGCTEITVYAAGHRDGGTLVSEVYAHPDDERARRAVRDAFDAAA